MRAFLAVMTLLTAAAWRVDNPRRERDAPEERGLTREQVEHYTGAHQPEIRACYEEQSRGIAAATGKLVLRATVLRNGSITELAVEAPGITGIRYQRLVQCIRDDVETWQLPVRRDDTQIVVPFLFQRVNAPGAGPQYSCWNPRGCPEKSLKRVRVE